MIYKVRIFLLFLVIPILCSCATAVLQKSLMERGFRNPDINSLIANPAQYQGQLFIFGGIIASTKVTADGSLLEGIYVPVDQYGYLENVPRQSKRFLASLRSGILDPVIYQTGRLVTIAGTFLGSRPGKFEDLEYIYPLFQIEDIYLWPKRPAVYYYYGPPPFYPGYPFYPPLYP
ncbi:MAG: Slp family lipoprotein [Syntrophorhabdus sp.]